MADGAIFLPFAAIFQPYFAMKFLAKGELLTSWANDALPEIF